MSLEEYFSKSSQFNKSISYRPATLLVMGFFIENCIKICVWNLNISLLIIKVYFLANLFSNFFYRTLVNSSFQCLLHQPGTWLNVNLSRCGCCFSLYKPKTYWALEAFIGISLGGNNRDSRGYSNSYSKQK